MVSKKHLKIGRKINDKLIKRGYNLDYFAGTIIGDMIEKWEKENKENE